MYATDILNEYIPEEIQQLCADEKVLYLGIGRDVWLPFGILGAKDVVAYDMIDFSYIPVIYNQNPITHIHSYATYLALDLIAMGDVDIVDMQVSSKTKSFLISFDQAGQRKTLKVFIANYDKVPKFPKAFAVISGGGPPKKKTVQRLLSDPNLKYWIAFEDDPDADLHVNAVFPSSLNEFENEWLNLNNLELPASTSQKVIRAFIKGLMNNRTQPLTIHRLLTT